MYIIYFIKVFKYLKNTIFVLNLKKDILHNVGKNLKNEKKALKKFPSHVVLNIKIFWGKFF